MSEKQYRANLKMRANMDKLTIIYECPCDNDKKHLHHPDYDRPLLVAKLCPSCHQQEHSRLGTRKYKFLCPKCKNTYMCEGETICWNCKNIEKPRAYYTEMERHEAEMNRLSKLF